VKGYIAHTSHCSGWNLDAILEATMFEKSGRTWRFPKDEHVSMLDWDFRRLKLAGFEETWKKHLTLARSNVFDVIMAPDLFSHCEYRDRVRQYEELQSCSRRVVLPVHVAPDENGLELAWPMGVWTRDYVSVWDVQDQVTHLLGGSPHAQLKMAEYFPNLKTIDGNQAFWCAVHFGRVWSGHWVTPKEPRPTNEECLRQTLLNITEAWKVAEK